MPLNMTECELDKISGAQCKELERRIVNGVIQTAEEADEAAAELTGESGLEPSTNEFDALLSILYSRAGKAFPGAWEDYPRKRLT